MLTPMMNNRLPEDRIWAADTGCFGAPAKHDNARYLAWLVQHRSAVDRCLFATAPDTWGDAKGTLARSRHMLPVIRAIGFAAALVAQDGLEHLPIPWDEFDCLFIGGGDPWRRSEAVRDIAREAKSRGKALHLGRVNSLRRLRVAQWLGCDSADGTFLKFGPDQNLVRMEQWLTTLQMQPTLFCSSEIAP